MSSMQFTTNGISHVLKCSLNTGFTSLLNYGRRVSSFAIRVALCDEPLFSDSCQMQYLRLLLHMRLVIILVHL